MAFKVFADANLLLDFILKRPSYASAERMIQRAIEGAIELFTTPSVLPICSYFTRQHFTAAQTREIILILLNDVQVIDCDHNIALVAANSSFDDLEDALQYYTALYHELDYFVSADKKLKRHALPPLPVYSATDLLSKIGEMDS